MKDGVYQDMSIEEYHANKTHLSATGLKHAKRCLKDLWYYMEGHYDKENVSHFDFGNAFELALLDPAGFDENVRIFGDSDRPVPDADYRNKKNNDWKKDFYKRNSGKYIINEDQWQTITHMLDACYRDSVIKKLIQNIEYQYSCFWTCPKTGLKFKCRPDLANVNYAVLVDVKTTIDGSPNKFRKQAASYDYYMQAITQIEGAQQSGLIADVREYYYLVVEKEPPYSAQLYRVPIGEWNWLRNEMYLLFERVKKAQDTNNYPGYTDRSEHKYGILELIPPPYYEIYKS